MCKNILSATLFFLILPLGLIAQSWAPVGAIWHYSYNNFSQTGLVKIECISDTVIATYNCQKLKKTKYIYDHIGQVYDSTFIGFEYTRFDNDQVYILRNEQFYTLYDFAALPGDIWTIPATYESFCDSLGSLKVIDIGDTLINQEILRYIVVEPIDSSEWVIYGTIIEKIGPTQWYMLPEQNCITDIFEGGQLRCYQYEEFIFETDIAPYCDYITNVDYNMPNTINVFPNPFYNDLVVNCTTGNSIDIIIQDLIGINRYEFINIFSSARIDLNKLGKGVYVITIIDTKSKDILKIKKIIKN